MTTIRRISVSQIDGNGADASDSNEIRPFGETAFYIDNNNKLTLMMFNGVRTHRKSKVLAPGVLWGSNSDSGDGNSYDTIKLIPDAELFSSGSDQYIIVDPTTPGHIHLRAGGTQDNSGASLFLGGENSNVNIPSGSNPPVLITANNNTWTFDTSGVLILPNGSALGDSIFIAASGTNAVLSQFDTNTQVYTMDYAVGVQTHNSGTFHTWLFNDGGDIQLPRSGLITETIVTNELWGTTTTSLTLVPGGAATPEQRLEIYSTGGGEGNHIHITSGDQNQTDLFLGNDTQYFSVGAMGQMEVRARPGLASPSPGTGAYAGSPVWIYAGDAGDNGGNTADGASGGDILLEAGISTANATGGSVYLQSASGPAGFGSIKLSTDNGSTYLEFNKDKQLLFPSGGDIQFDNSATSYIYGVTGIEFANGTTQTTAFTGTSALLDITNTNGIDTTYYLTFVENRTSNQEVRADVDLTFNSWSNTLGVSKISVNSTETSTSTVNGSLTVAGGVGVAKDMYVGGYVAQQALPAFRVIGNGGSISTGTTVTNVHFTIDFNQGNYLNTSTGVFTAPVSGIYSLNLVMRTFSNTNSDINQAIVYKNDSIAQLMLEYGVNTTMNHAGVSTIAKLNAGDTLKVVVAVGTMSFDANDNWSVAFLG